MNQRKEEGLISVIDRPSESQVSRGRGDYQPPGDHTQASQNITAHATELDIDGRTFSVNATESITLRCGAASITLHRDGRIVLRGVHVVSHASGVNRVRGGSVELN